MSIDPKVLSLLPLCLSLRAESSTIQLFLSHTCAHGILLVTILTMPISISSLLSCTLAPGSCREGCKPLLYQLRVSQVVCGPPPRAPPTSPHFPARPSSRAPSHSPLTRDRNGDTPLLLPSMGGRPALLPLEHAV